MQPLLNRFIRTFQKAINSEMEAMRQRLGPFEVLLDEGKALDPTGENQGKLYRFKIRKPNEKLVLQAECTLRYRKAMVWSTRSTLLEASGS